MLTIIILTNSNYDFLSRLLKDVLNEKINIWVVDYGKNLNKIHLRKRYWDDWSVGAYLISRKYAKILIDSFTCGDKFLLEYPEDHYWAPLAENLIYYSPKSVIDQKISYDVYTFPLFVESIEFISTFHGRSLEEKYKEDHLESYINILKWWKNTGKNLTLEQLLIK